MSLIVQSDRDGKERIRKLKSHKCKKESSFKKVSHQLQIRFPKFKFGVEFIKRPGVEFFENSCPKCFLNVAGRRLLLVLKHISFILLSSILLYKTIFRVSASRY